MDIHSRKSRNALSRILHKKRYIFLCTFTDCASVRTVVSSKALAGKHERPTRPSRAERGTTMWSYVDAINLALDALNAHEITLDQLDQYTNELWHDMEAQNDAEHGIH